MRTTHRCFAALQPSTVVCVCVCFSFSTCLFVWASDELIGAGADWLLLREGGNFSVILWLIIALKYVTVPTPSEVFLTGSFDVCFARGEAGRADKTSRPGNPLRGKQHTSALDRFVVQIVGKNNTEESGEENDRTRLPEAVRSVRDGARCRGDWSADGLFLENVSPKKQKNTK